jgi:hypothetical protein
MTQLTLVMNSYHIVFVHRQSRNRLQELGFCRDFKVLYGQTQCDRQKTEIFRQFSKIELRVIAFECLKI